jgi:ankyrin repeat protein
MIVYIPKILLLTHIKIVEFCHRTAPYDTCFSNLHNDIRVSDSLQFSRIWEENTAIEILDLLEEQSGGAQQVRDDLRLGYIIDALFTSWASPWPRSIEQHVYTLHSYLRPFVCKMPDHRLLEDVEKVTGYLPEAFLLFLMYMINQISNNLLSEEHINSIVQWLDNISGHGLLTKLFALQGPTMELFASNLLPAAICQKDETLVSILLDVGVNPNSPMGYNLKLPLVLAVELGNSNITKILLDAGAHVNAPPYDNDGRTALQAAAGTASIELVKVLLEARADVNAPPAGNHGRTALQVATEKGNIDLTEILIEARADINAPPSPYSGVTALQAAAIGGYIRVAQLLLDAGADVNAAPASEHGRTALEGAAEHGRTDMLQLLINAGADMHGSVRTRAIELARRYGHDTLCALLDRYG